MAWTTLGVSLVAVAAVSVDRLLALTLHLRYETLVTVPRVLQVTLKCVELIPDLVSTSLSPLLTVEHLKRSHPTFRRIERRALKRLHCEKEEQTQSVLLRVRVLP